MYVPCIPLLCWLPHVCVARGMCVCVWISVWSAVWSVFCVTSSRVCKAAAALPLHQKAWQGMARPAAAFTTIRVVHSVSNINLPHSSKLLLQGTRTTTSTATHMPLKSLFQETVSSHFMSCGACLARHLQQQWGHQGRWASSIGKVAMFLLVNLGYMAHSRHGQSAGYRQQPFQGHLQGSVVTQKSLLQPTPQSSLARSL